MRNFFSIFLLSFLLISSAGSVFAAGLVPCGNPGQNPCTICDFFVLISNIINFFLKDIIPPLAILLLAVGGGMYMFSGQVPALMARAKSVIVSTLIGLVIIYGAFVIVGTFLSLIGLNDWTINIYNDWMHGQFFKINCGGASSTSSTSSPTGGGNTITPSPTPAAPATPSTPATPATGGAFLPTFWDKLSDKEKVDFVNSETPRLVKSGIEDLGLWTETTDGKYVVVILPGMDDYYKFSPSELNELKVAANEGARMAIEKSVQNKKALIIEDVRALEKPTFDYMLNDYIVNGMKKEKINITGGEDFKPASSFKVETIYPHPQ